MWRAGSRSVTTALEMFYDLVGNPPPYLCGIVNVNQNAGQKLTQVIIEALSIEDEFGLIL